MGSPATRLTLRRLFTVFALLGLLVPLLGVSQPRTAVAATASVTVNVHLCDYDLTGLTVYQIAPLCSSQSVNNTVTLDNGSGITLQQATDGSGLTTFSNIDPGISTFYLYTSGDPNHGGIVAGCSQDDGIGNNVVPYALMPIGGLGDVNFFFLADGNMVYCDFFLFKPGVPPPAPTTYGSVTVNKITCPDGFDGYSADIYGLAQNCQDISQVVTFSLTDSSNTTTDATTPGSGINLANWSNIPSGHISIAESPMSGYGEPRVFCKNLSISLGDDPETEVGVANATAELELKSGYDGVYCDWFNIAYSDPKVDITITKYLCPEGYQSTNLGDLQSGCNEPYDPVTFKLDGASSGNPGDQTTGDVIPNGVSWTNMDPDTWYILEFLAEGYGEPIIFCSLIDQSTSTAGPYNQIAPEAVDDGYRISYTVDAGYNLDCSWFNTQGTPYGSLTIHKYGCPGTYQNSWSLNELIANCTTTVQGATFDVSGPNGFSDSQPLTGNTLVWDQLAPGSYTFSENQPSLWSGSIIFCATATGPNAFGQYEKVNSDNNNLVWDMAGGQLVDCWWYNLLKPVPVATIDPNAPATLTIVKFTCPEDYDPLATGAKPEDDCDGPTDGITFSVIGNKNASISRETGDDGDGTVTFKDLKPGNYLLQETFPENTENAFIWTCESDVRVLNYPFAPFARIDASGTLRVSLVAGETLSCDWYNVPSPEEDNSGDVELNVTLLHCASGQIPSSACDPADEGTGVSFTAVSGSDDPIDVEVDADGKASTSVPAGEYDVDADQAICFADSDAITADGTLDLTGDGPIDITLYICS